ncbi:unnamed protein product, partial [Iphiclides podalirius]
MNRCSTDFRFSGTSATPLRTPVCAAPFARSRFINARLCCPIRTLTRACAMQADGVVSIASVLTRRRIANMSDRPGAPHLNLRDVGIEQTRHRVDI